MKPQTSRLKDVDRIGFDRAAESVSAYTVLVENSGIGNLEAEAVAA